MGKSNSSVIPSNEGDSFNISCSSIPARITCNGNSDLKEKGGEVCVSQKYERAFKCLKSVEGHHQITEIYYCIYHETVIIQRGLLSANKITDYIAYN